MFFLNSILLWGSLAAAGAAVPIIIHLLSRYKSRPIDWAAMELLRRALVVRARRLRLEDLLLLLLRCLAAAVVALALSRPVLTPSGTSWFGGSGRAGVVIAIDGSYSMGHKSVAQSRFDMARERVRDVVATLEQGDTVTLVVMGKRPYVKLKDRPYDPEEIDKALKEIEPLGEPLNLEACLEKIQELVGDIKAPSRECYLVTDGQVITWKNVSGGARDVLEKLHKSCSVFFLPVGSDDAENLAVTQLAVGSGVLRTGSHVRYVADIRNAGRRTYSKVAVHLLVDEARVDTCVIDTIGPDETVSVPLFARFEKAGIYTISAQLEEDLLTAENGRYRDPLPIDNVRYAVADIRSTVNILVVDGDPSNVPGRAETGFLAAALVPEKRAGAMTLVAKTVTTDGLPVTGLSEYDIVILANVPRVEWDKAVALSDFVRRGGGLVVFPGDKVTPADLINKSMRDRDGAPLLPADLVNVVGEIQQRQPAGGGQTDKAEGWALADKPPDHPITRVLATISPRQLANIRFRRYFKVAPHKDARILLKLAPGGDPVLLEHSFGRGKVLLFTSTADRAWTDIVVHPAYLMLVQQTVAYLTRQAHETPVGVSEEVVFELSPEGAPSAVTVRDPGGKETQVLASDRNGHKAAVHASPDPGLPGVYTASWSQGSTVLKVAANVAPEESAIAVLQGENLYAEMANLPVRLIAKEQDIKAVIRESRLGRELWRTLLLVALGALAVESVLARLLARRMARAPEMSATVREVAA